MLDGEGEQDPRADSRRGTWRVSNELSRNKKDAGSWGAGHGGDVGRADRYAGG